MCFTATRGFHDQTGELFKQSFRPASTGPIIVFGETAPCVSVWLGTAMKDLQREREERRGEVGWGQREREEGREGEIERERRGGVGTERERKGERARLRERGEVGWGHRERGRERGRD